MFNLSAEQINECRLTLQAINEKSIDARQAVHDDKVAEYERKAAEQAERKAAAERAKARIWLRPRPTWRSRSAGT